MGAYVYLFPNAKLLVLVPFGILFPTTIKARRNTPHEANKIVKDYPGTVPGEKSP